MEPAAQLVLPIETPRPAGSGPAMADRLCALIVRRGRPLEVGHVVSQLLRMRRCPEPLQRRLVGEIVSADERLAWHGPDLVGLAPPLWATRDVRDAAFCVVDLETTGGAPGVSRVTEIGGVRVRGMRIAERFTRLVDPGQPIPAFITGITGIDDAMVRGRPRIDEALGEFVGFVGQDVLVAHNAPFDLRFLNYERRRLTGTYFTQPWLDTLALSRRLLAGRVGRHDLATLSDWAATRVRPSHRALPDAEATAELLIRLLEMLCELGHTTLEQAMVFGAPGGTRFAYKLVLADDLPSAPGVYLMRDRDGKVLYVGKARDLRRRVRAYFGPGGRHGRLIARAVEHLDHVDHEVCDTELDALLRESALLRSLRPPCNRRGVGAPAVRYLVAGDGDRAVRLVTSPPPGEPAAGPVRSGRRLERAVALLGVLYPASGGRRDPEEVRALLVDERGPGLAMLGARLARAAAEGRWTADEDGRASLAALMDVLLSCGRMRRAAARRMVLCEAEHGGGAVMFGVVGGRVVRRVPVDPAHWRAPARSLLRRLHAHPTPARLGPDDLDDALILEARARDVGARAVVLGVGTGAEEIARIGEALVGMRRPARGVRAAA